MNTAVAVVDMAGQRAGACIRKGQRAWSAIKATAEEQRVLWLEVGVALMYGKQKENRVPGQKFSDWVQETFPGLHERTARDAMWMAESFSEVASVLPPDLTHPMNIREWANNQKATHALPEDLQSITTTSKVVMEERSAVRAAKVIRRAAYGGEGSDVAKSQVTAMAQKNGVSIEEFTEAVKASAPDTYFGIVNRQLEQLNDFRENLRVSITEMEASGLSKDAIKNIFLQFANSL